MVDNVRSLNNIGSMFRTADGFAASAVVLCGISACPPSPEIHKTALGAEESMAWQYFASTADAIAALREQGWTIVCLEQVVGSLSLTDFVPEAANATRHCGGQRGRRRRFCRCRFRRHMARDSTERHQAFPQRSRICGTGHVAVYRTWLSNTSMQ